MRRMVWALCALAAAPLAADEGMWTLDNFPAERVEERFSVRIGSEWLERARLATVRMEGGCTGSFVSPDGLVLTNHHCVQRCVSSQSSAERDLAETGFLATDRDAEAPCEADRVSVLVETEEVTERVAAATRGQDERQANEARKRTLTLLEEACEAASEEADGRRLSCEAVALYNGGQYFLYKYRRYDDVRLVFVPESTIGAFGGDPDNFNFPRYCLDMALLRVYEAGRPVRPERYLAWRESGPAAGEPVFVTGHPGSTERLLTLAELRMLRNYTRPRFLLAFTELRGRLIEFGRRGEEEHRVSQPRLLRVENGLKVRRNELWALLDDELMERKAAEEAALRAAVAADPEMAAAYGGAWDEIERAMAAYRAFWEELAVTERATFFTGSLFDWARHLVRAAAERRKPSEERLREYTDAALPGLRQVTLAPRPVDAALEELELAFWLEKVREWLGPDDPFVKKALGRESPEALARTLVTGTRLGDPAVREALWEGGWEAVTGSDDPLIRFALAVDDDARAWRRRYEDEVEAPVQLASEKIARARFAIEGTGRYPDATFTLRVSFGAVEGWQEPGGPVPPFTTLGGVFERATGEDPFRLPESWLAARDRLPLDARFNFVATTDVTGGNSGSPVIDAAGNLVGLVFDGNIHSIAGAYWFDESRNRTVAVHPAAMMEALGTVYGASALVDELSAAAAAASHRVTAPPM